MFGVTEEKKGERMSSFAGVVYFFLTSYLMSLGIGLVVGQGRSAAAVNGFWLNLVKNIITGTCRFVGWLLKKGIGIAVR